ncbi:MAG: DUF5693 family protein [Bacillota bacterium]
MRKVTLLIIIIVLIYSSTIVLLKHQIETNNRQVELAIDYDSFANQQQLNLIKEFAAAGISSVAVTEKSLEQLAAAEKITIYNSWQLNLITDSEVEWNKLHKERLYISGPPDLLRELEKRLKYYTTVKYFQERNLLSFVNQQSELLKQPLYFSEVAQELVHNSELMLIPRFKTTVDLKDLEQTSTELGTVDTIIFSGKQVPAVDNIEQLAAVLNSLKINLGLIEPFLAQQQGANQLAVQMNYQAIRVHSISQEELENLGVQRTAARYLRAVKERNVRLLYLPAFADSQKTELLLSKLITALKNEGYSLGAARPFEVIQPSGWSLVLMIATLLIAILVPIREYIYLINPSGQENLIRTYILFITVSLISTAAGIIITGLLFDSSYLLQIKQFRGIKLAFTAPLVLSGLYLLSKLGGKEIKQRVLSGLKGSVYWWQLLVGLSLIVVFIVYVGRTTNQFIIGVSKLELVVRDFLAAVFGVRPRFKSFLIGHPLLLLGIYKSEARLYQWLLIGGLIGQINVINTLIHFHMPSGVSLLRVVLGLGLGLIIGTILIKIIDLWELMR